ncbi:MAG: hypothetical protein ACRC2R_22065 [Xenococcaceae cyanobacterium]
MTKFNHDDRKLVNFLQQHRPTPPSAAAQCENQMMELVERDHLFSKHKSDRPVWAFRSALVAGIFLSWNAYRMLIPQTQISISSKELEVFLVNSWHNGIGNVSDISIETMPSDSFSLLAIDRQSQLLLSHP